MGNLRGYAMPRSWESANLQALSILNGVAKNSASVPYAPLKNRSNLMGVSITCVDTLNPVPYASYGSILLNQYYCETLPFISGKINTLQFVFYNINYPTYAIKTTGHIKAYIYSLDSSGKPDVILYTSTNALDVETCTTQYTVFDFNFDNANISSRIAVGYAYTDAGGEIGWIGWLVNQNTTLYPYTGIYPHGSFYVKNLTTGISYESYGTSTDFSFKIIFDAKSATGIMSNRSAFTPQIRFY
jgi:hypothetical protein